MPQQFDLNEILENNPQVDREELAKQSKMADEIGATYGPVEQGYRLVPPYGGEQARILENYLDDDR